jgi:hypothetical protein
MSKIHFLFNFLIPEICKYIPEQCSIANPTEVSVFPKIISLWLCAAIPSYILNFI